MNEKRTTSLEKKAALEAIRTEFKGTTTNTQCARLLEALARFPVTTFEAMRFLDRPEDHSSPQSPELVS